MSGSFIARPPMGFLSVMPVSFSKVSTSMPASSAVPSTMSANSRCTASEAIRPSRLSRSLKSDWPTAVRCPRVSAPSWPSRRAIEEMKRFWPCRSVVTRW